MITPKHMAEKKNGRSTLMIMITAGVVVILIAFYFLYLQYAASGGQVAVQNNNQQTDLTAGWNTASNGELGFSLKYPNGFFDAGHEPKILVGDCNDNVFPDVCPDIVSVVANGGQGIFSPAWIHPNGDKITINNANYCLYQTSDAAMGRQYYYDFYTTVKNQKCLVVELDSTTTTCENYLPLEQGSTQQQQNYNDCVAKNQNQPMMLNQIVNTFTFTK